MMIYQQKIILFTENTKQHKSRFTPSVSFKLNLHKADIKNVFYLFTAEILLDIHLSSQKNSAAEESAALSIIREYRGWHKR